MLYRTVVRPSTASNLPPAIEATFEAYIGPTDFYVGVDPRLGVLSIPMLFKNNGHVPATVLDPELNEYLLDLAEPKAPILLRFPPPFTARLDSKRLSDRSELVTHLLDAGGEFDRTADGQIFTLIEPGPPESAAKGRDCTYAEFREMTGIRSGPIKLRRRAQERLKSAGRRE